MLRPAYPNWFMRWEVVTSVHNYISEEDNVIRKGAISAGLREKVIIPWNMRDGLILGVGKGNTDWNCSAPHGAGRAMSRGVARRTLNLHRYEQQMAEAGIWSSCVGADTLDEAPGAYKDSKSVEAYIEDTVEVTDRLKPIYNFKASDDPEKVRRKKERAYKRAKADCLTVAGRTLDGDLDDEGPF